MAIYTLTFRSDGESALERVREEDVRLAATAKTIALIAAAEEQAVIVLPSGFVHARTTAQRDRWALQLTSLSREHGVALAFGIDVADGDAWERLSRPRSFAFACDRGRKLLWAAEVGSSLTSSRALLLGQHRCVLLADQEVFQSTARELVKPLQPELVLALAHGAPTRRWQPALAGLDRFAPTLVVHDELPRRKAMSHPLLRGWDTVPVASDRLLSIRRHSPWPLDGARASYMGN